MTNQDMEGIVRRYIAAYNDFDIQGMATLLHSEIVFENLSGEDVTARTQGIASFLELAEQ